MSAEEVERLIAEARALSKQRRDEEALALIKRAIELDPKTRGAYQLKGWILLQPGHWQEAIAAFDAALQIDLTNVSCYENKGFALIQLDRYEEALEAYEQALKIDSNARIALYEKGKMLEYLALLKKGSR